MKKLSQEAEDYINQQDYNVLVDKDKNAIYRFGMKAAIINPILLEKQGLISLEDALGFAEWCSHSSCQFYIVKGLGWFTYTSKKNEAITTDQLYEIYKSNKNG